jgi:hypothetical protein
MATPKSTPVPKTTARLKVNNREKDGGLFPGNTADYLIEPHCPDGGLFECPHRSQTIFHHHGGGLGLGRCSDALLSGIS